jgi:hypothetical protein
MLFKQWITNNVPYHGCLTVKHNSAQFASCLSCRSFPMFGIHGQGTNPPFERKQEPPQTE